jgi:hypothetical protein
MCELRVIERDPPKSSVSVHSVLPSDFPLLNPYRGVHLVDTRGLMAVGTEKPPGPDVGTERGSDACCDVHNPASDSTNGPPVGDDSGEILSSERPFRGFRLRNGGSSVPVVS